MTWNSVLFALTAYALTLIVALGVAGIIFLVTRAVKIGQKGVPQQGEQK